MDMPKKNNNEMKILKITQITKAIIIPLIFSFLPVLGHCVIGIYLMKQEDNCNIGAIIFLFGIFSFFCWWFTSMSSMYKLNGLKRNQRLKEKSK